MKTNFKNTFFKVVIISAFFVIVFAPAFALAEIKLELNYPSLPGIIDLASSTQSLQMAVRYYVQLGVIIAILVCIVSLVWAGVSYISSTGQPGAMKQARERIFNTFIGLAILIGSFIILKTISPQMSLLSIVKPSVPTGGIVLISKDGYSKFIAGTSFGDLVQSGLVKSITADIANLGADPAFGPLKSNIVYIDITENNYTNFRLYAIGFWGETSKTYKVTLFSDLDFSKAFLAQRINKGDRPLVFTYDGAIKADGSQTVLADVDDYFQGKEYGLTDKMKIFIINGHTFTGDGTEAGSRNQAIGKGNLANDYPPQSIRIENFKVAPYIAKADGSKVPVSSSEDTTNDGAVAVNILNTVTLPGGGGVQKGDALYIASDDTYARGNRAIYFQYRTSAQLQNVVPKLFFSSQFFEYQNNFSLESFCVSPGCDNKDVINVKATKDINPADASKGKYPSEFEFVYYKDVDVNQFIPTYGKKDIGKGVNVPFGKSAVADFPYDGIYGAIKEADPDPDPNKPGPEKGRDVADIADISVCQEVSVCKKNGHCLKFVPAGTKITVTNEWTHYLPMPFFRPIKLPDKITSFRINDQTNIAEPFSDSFNDEVVKVEIKGKCLVVLFEKRLAFTTKDNTQFQGFNQFASLAFNEYTGSKSVIVTSGGSLGGSVAMQCTTGVNRFLLLNQDKDPCASSIVVFPGSKK